MGFLESAQVHTPSSRIHPNHVGRYVLCFNTARLNIQRPPKGSTKKKPGVESEVSTPTFAEQLSYLHNPRPFKNPNYTKHVNRRAKNLKNVLAQEREREKQERERRRLEKEQEMDVDDGVPPPPPPPQPPSSAADTGFEEDIPTYTSIEAPPSLLPPRKYCDITGLEASYTDPATNLRYHDKSVYELIRGLSMAAARDYLAARGVNPIVR